MDQSIRIGQLPSGTQEALLQQALEPLVTVLRVSITEKFHEAVVELDSADVRPSYPPPLYFEVLPGPLTYFPLLIFLLPFQSVATFLSTQSDNPFTFNNLTLPIIPATQRFPLPASVTVSTAAAAPSGVITESTPAAATTSDQRPPPRPQTGRRKGPAVAFSGKGKGAGAGTGSGGGDVEMKEKPKPKGQDAFRAMLNEKK
jgi:hypothetical protein